MQIGDLATWVSGLATTGVVLFAGVELRQLRRREAADRRIELAGVAVEWRLAGTPAPPTVEGMTESEYVFTLHNPGRLPVTHVDVEVSLPLDVRMVASDGSLGAPCRGFHLDTPVVAGNGSRDWWRTVQFPYDERSALRDITATVRFRELDGCEHQTHWGRPHNPPATPSPGARRFRPRQAQEGVRSTR